MKRVVKKASNKICQNQWTVALFVSDGPVFQTVSVHNYEENSSLEYFIIEKVSVLFGMYSFFIVVFFYYFKIWSSLFEK